MKRYRYPLILAKQFRGFNLRISQHNVVPPCPNGVNIPRVDVALIPNCRHFGRSLGLMHYSTGNLGLDRIPANFDDNPSNGGAEVSDQLGNSRQRNRADYMQNVEQFQQWSNSGSHNHVNGGTNTQHLGHGYLEKASSQQFDRQRSTNFDDIPSNANSCERDRADYMQNVEHFQQWSNPESHNHVNGGTNTQHLGHDYLEKAAQQNPGGRVATSSQHFDGQWSTNSSPFQQYPNNLSSINAVSHHPDGYQQQNIGWNVNNLTGVEPYNVNVNNESIKGILEELDAVLKSWDLESAVICMENLSSRGVDIDLPRYLALIEACGKAKALVEAKVVHEHLLKHLSPVSVSVFNRILEMYGKCGSMSDAYDTFNKMPECNLTSWDNMIGWYAKNGLGEEAIDMFTKFKEARLKPDGQMFFSIFDACGVVGDVTEGMLHFDSMSKVYGISPTMDHYASIVRMFGSACDLDGALEFIEKMPVEPTVDVWESLMNMSRIQGNIELGDRCAEIIDHLDPSRLTKESKSGLLGVKDSDTPDRKVKKASLLDRTQHEYRAGDRSSPESEKIYALLRGFKESMKEAGYVPETRFVLHDITQEEKEEAIMAHSERLACAYSLMTTSPRAEMRIIKNLRVCGDCHAVFKILSKLVGRKIIMRDQKRFHHFKDGKCSCNDYW